MRGNPDNMCQVLDLLEKRLAGRRVIRYMKGTETIDVFAEQFFERIRRRSCLFKSRGLDGKHIGIIGKNSCEWLVNYCAIFRAGAVAVLLDRELDAEAIKELAERVDLDAVLFDASTEEQIRMAVLPEHVQMLSMDESQDEDTLQDSRRISFKINRRPEELACIFFTSGTTVKSKAVMMSESAMAAGTCNHLMDGINFKALLAVLPFHHLSGAGTLMNTLYLGAEICIAEDLKYFYRYLTYMKPDYVMLVPSMLQMLARKLKNGGPNGSLLGWDLKIIGCGGAAFCPEFLQMLTERKITVLQGYGASEAGNIGFLWEMTPEHPDTIGKPSPELEIKIVEDELFLRSRSVMMGYYGDREETEKVLCDGWYATGDLCRMDEEGYLYLTGRRKNLIILSNGENVSPEAVESRLQVCGDIEEIVVSVEGNLIIATVFPRFMPDGSEESREKIKARIKKAVEQYNADSPVYKQIQKLYFRDEPFAKTASGNIVRHNMTGGNS